MPVVTEVQQLTIYLVSQNTEQSKVEWGKVTSVGLFN